MYARRTICEADTREADHGRGKHDQLRAAVAASLYDSGYAALSYVDCEVHGGGEVVLEGCVPTYHLKQLAQTFAQRVAGVRQVRNCLAVRRPGDVKCASP